MPIFSKSTAFVIDPDDLESKIYTPSRELYSRLSTELNAALEVTKSTLSDWHSDVAAASLTLYEHPVETMTAWYEQSVQHTTQYYVYAETEVMPIVIDTSQELLSNGKEIFTSASHNIDTALSHATLAFNAFTADPVLESEQLISEIKDFSFDVWNELLTGVLQVSDIVMVTSQEFINQPAIYMDSIIYAVLNNILVLYSIAATSLLQFV